MINDRKVAVVGCGFVGSSSAFALMQSGLFSEMVLIDVDTRRAEGEALDIVHGVPFASPMKIYAGTYDDVADAAIIVGIFKSIIPQIRESGFKGILLVVANPVDVLTYAAIRMSGLPEGRVIGSGTVLDTARLKYMLGEHLEDASFRRVCRERRSRLYHGRARRFRVRGMVERHGRRRAAQHVLRDARASRP